jgi:peroxiredoxin
MANDAILQRGTTLPCWQLPEASGRMVRYGDFRGRRNLVVFLGHPPGCEACEGMLRELAAGYGELIAEEAEVLAILQVNQEEAAGLKARLDLPFPLLTDAGGILGGGPAIAVVDRYGEVFTSVRADDGHLFPSMKYILEWLGFIEVQCPE